MSRDTPIPAELLHQELARLSDSPEFRRAPTHQRLLNYLVRMHAGGTEAAVSERAIALAVFQRDPETYDPCSDPIVRVSVGRLRERLEAHYAATSAPPRLRFVLPRGGYRLGFEPVPQDASMRAG